MAEETQGGFNWQDLAKSGLSGLFGGPAAMAFSPAASGFWDSISGNVGMSGDQGRSLAKLLYTALSGAGILGLAPAAFGLAKNFSTPTQPRAWNTPARGPNGLFELGRSDPAAFTGAPQGFEYLSTDWSPGSAMFFAPELRHDVEVGPGSAQGMQHLMNQPMGPQKSGSAISRVGDIGGRARAFIMNHPDFQGGQMGPQAMPTDPFSIARQQLGMGSPMMGAGGPDFSRARQLLGMG